MYDGSKKCEHVTVDDPSSSARARRAVFSDKKEWQLCYLTGIRTRVYSWKRGVPVSVAFTIFGVNVSVRVFTCDGREDA
mgnify:CR=1 FL=1|jgi:hypothetical protein